MPVQVPLHEEFLWKGKIQLARYPEPRQGPEFVKPKLNWLTGIVLNPPNLTEENNRSYDEYSKKYWAGLRKRNEVYRTNILYLRTSGIQ